MTSQKSNSRSLTTLTSPQGIKALKFHCPLSLDSDEEPELRMFCLAFRPDNKIHLFPPSKSIAHLLRDTVGKHWTLEADELSMDCYTLNLKGTPFLMYSRRENAMIVKYICCLILERFRAHGWTLAAWTDLSRKTDLTTWYFVKTLLESKQVPAGPSNDPWIICLSLSAKRKLQLINAPPDMHRVLKSLVEASYEAGIDTDAEYGRDYQIKLKGNPWDTEDRDKVVSACGLIADAFDEFANRGYHFYGSVNLKDTADSFFFEQDPQRDVSSKPDAYMIITFHGHHILRLIRADLHAVEAVKSTIDKFWTAGLEAEGQIANGSRRTSKLSARKMGETVTWEFVLKGSPWEASATKIGQSRQFITLLLDSLLVNGWTTISGLDISRVPNKKSALLFRRCRVQPGLTSHHACSSPLGCQRYQLINAPASLQGLVRDELKDVVMHERSTEHQQAICELTLSGCQWWTVSPEQEREPYIRVRRRMGRLLQALMDAHWHLVASADVVRQTNDDKNMGGGIHSWYLLACGDTVDSDQTSCPVRHTPVFEAAKNQSDRGYTGIQTGSEDRVPVQLGKTKRLTSAPPHGSHSTKPKRVASPPEHKSALMKMQASSRSGHDISNEQPKGGQRPTRYKLTSAMKSKSTVS